MRGILSKEAIAPKTADCRTTQQHATTSTKMWRAAPSAVTILEMLVDSL